MKLPVCIGGNGLSTAAATVVIACAIGSRAFPIQQQIDSTTIIVAQCSAHKIPEVVGDPVVAEPKISQTTCLLPCTTGQTCKPALRAYYAHDGKWFC